MNWGIVGAAMLVISIMCVGCGSDTNNQLPTPNDPADAPPRQLPGTGIGGQDPRLPDLTGSAPVKLLTYSNYSALEEFFTVPGSPFSVAPPLVGDPKLKLDLAAASGNSLNGDMLFLAEDAKGAFWLSLNSFPLTGYRGTNGGTQEILDIIFQDDFLVVRISANRNGNDLSGSILYKVNDPNRGTKCKSRTNSCTVTGTPQTPPPPECAADFYAQEDAQICRNYMTGAAVKTLGTFEAKFSDWVN